MRIPFLGRRKQTPTLYQKGIENEFELNKRAQYYLVRLFSGESKPLQMMEFIFEQVYIVYSLACFAGSHEVSAQARIALCLLREEFQERYTGTTHIFLAETVVACSTALKSGEAILQELPRSEFKLAYVQAKRLTESPTALNNYLELFHDKGNCHSR